jgi:hypothetical protein
MVADHLGIAGKLQKTLIELIIISNASVASSLCLFYRSRPILNSIKREPL